MVCFGQMIRVQCMIILVDRATQEFLWLIPHQLCNSLKQGKKLLSKSRQGVAQIPEHWDAWTSQVSLPYTLAAIWVYLEFSFRNKLLFFYASFREKYQQAEDFTSHWICINHVLRWTGLCKSLLSRVVIFFSLKGRPATYRLENPA